MTAFSFSAYNQLGQRERGTIEADTPLQARNLLRERGLFPEQVEDASAPATAVTVDADSSVVDKTRSVKRSLFSRRKKISAADLCLLTRQLATLLAAGIALDEALTGVADQSDKAVVRSVMLAVRSKVLEGHSLAVSLEQFPHVFPKIYRVSIQAGEHSGHLDSALLQLADYTEKQQYIRGKVKQALIYPSLMATVACSVIVFLILYVVPKIITVFQDSQMALPKPTIIMLAASGFLQHYGLYLLLVILLLLVSFRKALNKKPFKRCFDRLLLKTPVIGNTILVLNCARFSRTLGILMNASVPVLDAMRYAALLISPLPMHEAVVESIDTVRSGGSIHHALQKAGYFPPMFLHLLASGEKSGHLEAMLMKISEHQDKEVENVLQTVLALFEPAMILVMGGAVLFIVLAVLLPIFSMDQMIS